MKHKTNRHEKIIKKIVISPHAIDNTAKMMMADAAKKAKIGKKKVSS
ncbi:hypothetical protein [Hallella colorans]|nr:hypothetical protein [Hallella colorans]